MKNTDIIMINSIALLREGVLTDTGKDIIYQISPFDLYEGKEPEPIHTFQGWKALGYSVKKGEKSIANFQIWKSKTRKIIGIDGKETTTTDMFLTKAHFFKFSQVQQIQEA